MHRLTQYVGKLTVTMSAVLAVVLLAVGSMLIFAPRFFLQVVRALLSAGCITAAGVISVGVVRGLLGR